VNDADKVAQDLKKYAASCEKLATPSPPYDPVREVRARHALPSLRARHALPSCYGPVPSPRAVPWQVRRGA
jgi:hypothetical protein